MSAADSPPLRVEQALRLLPPLEALAPLRSLLLSTSQGEVRGHGPYHTVGKRGIRSDLLREGLAATLRDVNAHIGELYEAYVSALEAQERGDTAAAVEALRAAGQREEQLGRLMQARSWYEAAGHVAAELRDRKPEIETLTRLGSLSAMLGRYAEAARQFQRALVLAEAEFDQSGAIAACDGLGRMAVARGEWTGALAWHTRALRLAQSGGDADVTGRQYHRLATLALRRGDLAAVGDPLARAREAFERQPNPVELAWTLRTEGLLHARMGRTANAHAAFREALAWAAGTQAHDTVDLAIRLDIAELHIGTARYLEAEEELHRAEQVAVERRAMRWVARVYALMGRLRGLQHDQAGFVFFEEAMRLCGGLDVSPALEALVLREYGEFCLALDLREEARAYLERAREIFDALGHAPDRDAVRAELQRTTA